MPIISVIKKLKLLFSNSAIQNYLVHTRAIFSQCRTTLSLTVTTFPRTNRIPVSLTTWLNLNPTPRMGTLSSCTKRERVVAVVVTCTIAHTTLPDLSRHRVPCVAFVVTRITVPQSINAATAVNAETTVVPHARPEQFKQTRQRTTIAVFHCRWYTVRRNR